MRPSILGLALVLALVLAIPFVTSLRAENGAAPSTLTAQNAPPGGPGGPPGGMPRDPAQMAAMRDTIISKMIAHLGDQANAPAESVFKNVQVMKGIPAGRFLQIMNHGFATSLGVGCNFCHVQGGKWDADDKKEKKIAREMWKMTGTINNDLLAKIPDLDEDNKVVNCTTCHRGDKTPATNMPSPAPAH